MSNWRWCLFFDSVEALRCLFFDNVEALRCLFLRSAEAVVESALWGSPFLECARKSESGARVVGSPFLECAGSSECFWYVYGGS
jgi:hypothetical protein